ncbi:MAG: SDR family NAD(P)-dependent oxidoreductase, partial [Mycobacterium sp.]|nr:SDR family NAD(P)-dependent oxidoreductase [Mycobacterium sp.]
MKTAVVTGGASGIGAAISDRLRADGLQVATLDLNAGEEKFSYAADVTDRVAIDAALEDIRAEL